MEVLCMNILLWYCSYPHSWCSTQIRGEQLQAACPFLSTFLSFRLVLKIWWQLIKQSRSLQPGFALFDTLIVIFLGCSSLCLIHRLKCSLVLDSSPESLDLKHLTWLLLPLLESIVCEQNMSATPLFLNFSSLMENNSWELQGSVIKIQIMDSTTLTFKYTSTFLLSFKMKLTAFT